MKEESLVSLTTSLPMDWHLLTQYTVKRASSNSLVVMRDGWKVVCAQVRVQGRVCTVSASWHALFGCWTAWIRAAGGLISPWLVCDVKQLAQVHGGHPPWSPQLFTQPCGCSKDPCSSRRSLACCRGKTEVFLPGVAGCQLVWTLHYSKSPSVRAASAVDSVLLTARLHCKPDVIKLVSLCWM